MNAQRWQQRLELMERAMAHIAMYTRHGAFPAEGELHKLRVLGEEWIKLEVALERDKEWELAKDWCVEEAILGGERAAERGDNQVTHCPYPKGDYRHVHWQNGFNGAEQERRVA